MSKVKALDCLTAERLMAAVSYERETGLFYRLPRAGNRNAERPAGTVNKIIGYAIVCVDGKQRYAHRLAWLYVYGQWPDGSIDHINGIRTDNRIENLRDVSHKTNMQNIRSANSRNSSGFLGVMPSLSKWQAQINIDGKQTYLGRFDTPELAHEAYVSAKRKNHAGCTI